MDDFERIKKTLKEMSSNLTEEEIEKHAKFMSEKKSTIKKGDNVIHLTYYHELLDDKDILEIENNISTVGLELSRYDKSGVLEASLEEFILQVSISLGDPIVSNITLGVVSSAVWDTIKVSTIYIWKKIKERVWDKNKAEKQIKRSFNFGLHIRLDENTAIDLKLDGEMTEETILKVLDKVPNLIKYSKRNKKPKLAKFISTDKNGEWKEINVEEEIRKKIINK